ncbi:alpha/beta fold hydrolase [Faecalimonas umbilicata]|nr:alpha/beta fold hydrolase [Faecalimonas umbilicata]
MRKIIEICLLCIGLLLTASGCTQSNERSEPEETVSTLSPVENEVSEIQEEGMMLPDTINYDYEIQELCTERDGRRIYGVIYIPKTAQEKMPTVIFSHGYGGSYQGSERYAQALAEKGYVSYRFDFSGGSSYSHSDGSTLEMSLFTEQADLEAVIRMIQGLAYVDSEKLFLIGASQGGVVSAITGAAHVDEIRGMVLIYPAFVMVDDAKELFGNVENIPDTYYFMGMNVGRNYFEPLLDYDIFGAIAAYDKDVWIIHGDADRTVPVAYSEQALEVYPSAELKVMPDAGHGFHGEDVQQAIDWILEYLQNHQD